MTSKYLGKGLKRSALTIALGLCFAGGVSAQSSVGSIFGDTAANSAVTIENMDTGTSREISSDASGHFAFSQLAPGRYRVTSSGVSREVSVKVGTGTQVSLAAADGNATNLDTVTVIGSAAINPIDVSSVESTTVFTAQQIAELPVGRDITSVALLAPGTVKGDTGLGNLASFGGASVAENGYYINGFDVTNIRNFLSFADLPFDAIGEQQVKTGGYGAEFGRSLGGVLSVVTKRGTNEWKGGVSAYWNPSSLREPGKDVLTRDETALAIGNKYYQYRSDDESDSWSVDLWGGGPLIKDRLFFFGLIEGGKSTRDVYNRDDSTHTRNDSPSGMLKLDWNITDNHILEFTGIYNKTEDYTQNYDNAAGQKYTGEHGTKNGDEIGNINGGEVGILKYTGYLTDNFTISAMAGYLRSINNQLDPALLPGAECPAIYDSREPGLPLTPLGCWNESQFTLTDPSFAYPEADKRRAFRLDAEWRLGAHNLRFGIDREKFTSSHPGVTYSGGVYYRYFQAGDIFGEDYAFLGDIARKRETFSATGSYEVINQAAYLEDSWQVTDNLMLYGGIRAETFENLTGTGSTFIKSDKLWAPRVGFSWDVNGDATFKVFGNAGRYYIPVASNTNIRGSGFEYSSEEWFFLDGVNSDGTPQLGDVLIPKSENGSLVAPDPATLAGIGLKPMYQDEFILGMQHQLNENWQLGLRAISREVKSGMDDYCAHNGLNQWAADNGFDGDFATDGIGIDPATCVIINPGDDLTINMDPDNNGTLETYTVPASYIGMPKYQRKYQALEIFWERGKSDGWYLQGSYTFAKSRGNVEGYVNSTLEQTDAGATQDFDFPEFEAGAFGYLPNDRRHTLKLFGAYEWSDEWMTSLNFIAQSGRPVNCNGFMPVEALGIEDPDASSLGQYSGSSFYCLDPNGEIVLENTNPGQDGVQGTGDDPADFRWHLHNRGDMGRTPWMKTFDLSVRYTPNWASKKLQFQATVFNVLNSATVTEYNESSQVAAAATVFDPNYRNNVNFQAPRSVRLSVRYEF